MADELMILPASAIEYANSVTRRKGHAGHPGRGPKGETCGSCVSRVAVNGGAKAYSKCEMNRRNWTRGSGSDIRKRDPACEFWKVRTDG